MKPTLLLLLFFCLSANAQEKYTVYFDTGQDSLNKIYSSEFQNWMDWHKGVNVVKIQGFADGVGKAGANDSLSWRRANTIVALLEKNGVTLDEKVIVEGLGEIGKDQSDAGNRKALIWFDKTKPKITPLEKQIKKAKVGSRITLSKLVFERNSGRALPGSSTQLNNLVAIMQANPNMKIDIQGHICCNADDTKNLGLLRAKAVYNHLINAGIDKSRVTYRSFGSTRPIYPIPEKNAVEAEANRRVEIEIVAN
jgi:outer membrane protein OmpA-like peptidoglycan-associated protein